MESIQSYCSKCSRYTNHQILFNKTVENADDDIFESTHDFQVIECMGCNNISFREEYWDETQPTYENSTEYVTDVSIYPLVLKVRNKINSTHLLPQNVKIAYAESINAFKNNCKLLTAAGFRVVLEAVCNDKGIKGKDINSKINKLHSNGFLSKTEADRLHAVRFLGNDSLHEIEVPTERKLLSALAIIEHLLSSLYMIDVIISYTMDTMITRYQDFEELVYMQLHPLEKDETLTLRKILGKSIRRITAENLEIFERQLQSNIKMGGRKILTLGDIVPENRNGKNSDVQNYIFTKGEVDDFI